MSVTKRQPSEGALKPKISLKQALSSNVESGVYQEVGELLKDITSNTRRTFYRDIVGTQLAQQPQLVVEEVAQALRDVQRRVKTTIQKPLNCKNYSEWITKEQYLAKIAVEELLRQHKLAESFKSKIELENKLKQVNSDITRLADERALASNKLNLQDSKVRKQFFHLQEQLAFEVSEDTQKRRKEQAERQRRLKERQREIEAKIQEDLEAAEKEKLLTKEQQEEQYRNKLQSMQYQLIYRRQARAEKLKRDQFAALALKKKKPLFVKMEETFKTKVEMPELAKTKAQLAKKRELFSPVRTDELALFAFQHDEIIKKKKKEKERVPMTHSYSAKAYSTKFTEAVLEQERLQKLEVDRLEKERRKRADKMKSYANLVKKLHPPTVDDQKAEELEQLKKKIHHTVRSNSNRLSVRQSVSPHSESQQARTLRPRKLKKMNLKETRDFKSTDYLAELRKGRTDYDSTQKLVSDIKGKLAVLTGSQPSDYR